MDWVVKRSRLRSAPGPALPPGEQQGTEQLKNELAAAEFRLRTAEQTRKGLELLLVPVEELRRELAREQRKVAGLMRTNATLDSERQKLAAQLQEAEAKVADAAAENARLVEICGKLQDAEDLSAAMGRLQIQAVERERQLEKACRDAKAMEAALESERFLTQSLREQLAATRAARAATETWSEEAEHKALEAAGRERAAQHSLMVCEREKEELLEQLERAYAEATEAGKSRARLEGELADLRRDHTSKSEALHNALVSEGELRDRLESVPSQDATWSSREGGGLHVAPGGDVPIPAQSATSPEELVFGRQDLLPPAPPAKEAGFQRRVVPPQAPPSPPMVVTPGSHSPRLPRSRRDYPKGAHGRLARRVVLGVADDVSLPEVACCMANNKARWHALKQAQSGHLSSRMPVE